MLINREQYQCYDRAFIDDGLLQFFRDWIVRPIVASPTLPPAPTGGPGWYIIEDNSALPANPYIVISDHTVANLSDAPNGLTAAGAFVGAHKILKISAPDATPGVIRVQGYLWWNTAVPPAQGVGYGNWLSVDLPTANSQTFEYSFRGGPTFIAIGAKVSGVWNFIGVGDFVGDTKFIEGPSVCARVEAPVTAGTPALVTLNVSNSNFPIGSYYFIYDFNGFNKIDFSKVTGHDGTNGIYLEKTTENYAIGSVVASWMHRMVAVSPYTGYGRRTAPYASLQSKNYGSSTHRISLNRSVPSFHVNSILGRLTPNLNGKFIASNPVLAQQGSAVGDIGPDMDNGLGPVEWLYVSSNVGMDIMGAGRDVEGIKTVYVNANQFISSYASLLPDYDSNS